MKRTEHAVRTASISSSVCIIRVMPPGKANEEVAPLSICEARQLSRSARGQALLSKEANSPPHFFCCQHMLHNPVNHLLVLFAAKFSFGAAGRHISLAERLRVGGKV